MFVALVPVEGDTLQAQNIHFVQSEDNVEDMVAVYPYGAFIIPADNIEDIGTLDIVGTVGEDTYTGSIDLVTSETQTKVAVGDTVTFTKSA